MRQRKPTQLSLLDRNIEKTAGNSYGGTKTIGRRKTGRPWRANKRHHIILKSSKANGALSFLNPRNKGWIDKLIHKTARKYQITVHELVNVGNHLHITLTPKDTQQTANFFRFILMRIMLFVTGARKGNKFGKFWDTIYFSRILTSSFEVLQLSGYFKANKIEIAKGAHARNDFLKQWNEWMYQLKYKRQSTA